MALPDRHVRLRARKDKDDRDSTRQTVTGVHWLLQNLIHTAPGSRKRSLAGSCKKHCWQGQARRIITMLYYISLSVISLTAGLVVLWLYGTVVNGDKKNVRKNKGTGEFDGNP